MPRIARTIAIGYPHHIVQRGNNRQLVFYDNQDRQLYVNLLKKYSLECGCGIYAYCLMDNHVHILLVPESDDSIAKTMQKLSLRFTQHINKKYERTGRLWECRFYSSIVDKDAYFWSVCRYIERNPVRAKKVSEPTKYQWSSATLRNLKPNKSFLKSIWKDKSEQRDYLAFLKISDDQDEKDLITKSVFRGRPTGAKKFFDALAEDFGIAINVRGKGRPRKAERI